MTKIQPTFPGWYSPPQQVGSVRETEQQPTSPCPALPYCGAPWQVCRSRCDGTICVVRIAWRGDAGATSSINVRARTLVTAFPSAPVALQRRLQGPAMPANSSYPSEDKPSQQWGQSFGFSEQGVCIPSASGYLGLAIALLTISTPSGRLQASAWSPIFSWCPEKIINHSDKFCPKQV